MAAGSLVVRVSADINDFSRKLNAITKDVNKAADQIASIGKKLTVGITLPAIAAGVALARMAVENQEVSRKMARVFGESTNAMQTDLNRFTKMVPVAGTDIQRMATELAELGDELGATGDQAKSFARNVLDVSVKLAAARGVGLSESVDAISNAMKGQTRALKSLGVVVSETDIKQRAYAQGLAQQGKEVSTYAGAMATLGILMEKSNKWAGEVGASQENLGTQFRMAQVALTEFADATSDLLIPALTPLAKMLQSIADWMNNLAPETRKLIMVVVGFAAVLGPLAVTLAAIVKIVSAVAAAISLIAAPVWLAIAAGVAVLTGAIVLLNKAFRDSPKYTAPTLGNVTYSNATPYPMPKKRTPFTGVNVSAPASSFGGFGIKSSLRDQYGGYSGVGNQSGGMTEVVARALESVAQVVEGMAMGTMLGQLNAPNAMARNAASRSLYSDGAIRNDIASGQLRDEDMIRFREELVKLPSVFNATRIAALEFGEKLKSTAEDFGASLASFKAQWSNAGNAGKAAMGALKESVAGLVKEFSIWGLILRIINDILSGIGPQISAVLSPLKALGQMLGVILLPIFRILYSVVKGVVIALGWLGSTVLRVTGGLHVGIGKLLVGIGNALNKLPGSIGNPLKKMGEGFLKSATDHYKMADQLTRAYKQLAGTSWDEALNGVDALGDAAKRTSQELLNVPSTFKYALRAFQSSQAITVGAGAFAPGSGPNQTTGGPNVPTQIVINVSGKEIASITLDELRRAGQSQFGNAALFPQLAKI